MEEANRREQDYVNNEEGCYILHIGNQLAIDATREFQRLERLINHAASNCNIQLHRPVTINGQKCVPFVATKKIAAGEELFFDYGIRYVLLSDIFKQLVIKFPTPGILDSSGQTVMVNVSLA